MRFSKWRGALLTFVTIYASIALIHAIFHFDAGPFESVPSFVSLIFWPTSLLAGFSNTLSLGSWVNWFWTLESVLASTALWALGSWPIDHYMKKKGQYRHAGYIERLASWWELAFWILLAAAMGGAWFLRDSALSSEIEGQFLRALASV